MLNQLRGRTSVCLWVSGCVLGCTTLVSAQAIDLRPKFEKGSVVYKEISTDEDQIVTKPYPSKTTIKGIVGIIETVESVDKEGANVSLKFDRLSQRMSYSGQEWAWDSDHPDAPGKVAPISEIYRLLLANVLRAEIDAAGRAKGLKGIAEFLDQARGSASNTNKFDQLTHDMSDDVYRFMLLDSIGVLYPEKPVKPGDSWDAKLTKKDPSLGEVECNYKIKLDKIEDRGGRRVALLSYTRDMKLIPGTDPPPTMMGRKTSFDSGRANGTAVIDFATGRIVELQDAETSTINAAIIAPGAKDPTTEGAAQVITRTKVRIVPVDERRREKAGPAKPPSSTPPAPPAAMSKPAK